MTRAGDRRRTTRVRLSAVATLETTGTRFGNNQAVCAVKDVSRLGIGLETGQPPQKGQTVILRLLLDDRVHELRTRAKRVTRRGDGDYYAIGLDWSECTREQLDFLDEVLRAVEAQPLG
jgi:hypothetical protein